MLTFDPILSHLTPLSADTVPLFESYKLKLETEQFICRGLFWTSDEQESYRFSIQYHEQPNVLGINNELLGILIKVPTTTTITSQFILLCIAIILTFVCTKLKFLKTSLCCNRRCSPTGVLLTALVAVCYKIALLFEG